MAEEPKEASSEFLKFECGICLKEFSTSWCLQIHIKTHDENRSFDCHECGKVFADFSLLCEHLRVHIFGTDQVENVDTCSVCGKEYPVSQLPMHKRSHVFKPGLTCNYCGKSFGSSKVLKLHQRTHGKFRPFQCSTCGLKFASRNAFMLHWNTCCSSQQTDNSQSTSMTENKIARSLGGRSKPVNDKTAHCSKKYPGFVAHAKVQSEQQKPACQFDEQDGVIGKGLKASDMVHEDGNTFSCTVCKKVFHSKQKAYVHTICHRIKKKTIHKKPRLYLQDPQKREQKHAFKFDEQCVQIGNIVKASDLVHEDGNTFSCTVCKKVFDSKQKAYVHTICHRKTGKGMQKRLKPNLQHIDSKKIFKNKHTTEQDSHSKKSETKLRMSGKKSVQLTCSECWEKFDTDDELKVHQNIHLKEHALALLRILRPDDDLTGSNLDPMALAEAVHSVSKTSKMKGRKTRVKSTPVVTDLGVDQQSVPLEEDGSDPDKSTVVSDDCVVTSNAISSGPDLLATNDSLVSDDDNNPAAFESPDSDESDQTDKCLPANKTPATSVDHDDLSKDSSYTLASSTVVNQEVRQFHPCVTRPDVYEKILEVNGTYQCAVCLKKLTTRRKAMNHVRNHVDEKPFKCDECGLSLGRKHAMDLHKKRHEKRRALGFPPLKRRSKIVKTFSAGFEITDQDCTNVLFEQNSVEHTPEKAKNPFADTDSSVVLDQSVVDSGNMDNVPIDSDSSIRSFNVVNEEVEKSYHPCVTRHEIYDNMLERNGKYQCGICFKELATRTKAMSHVRNHVVEKPFKCDECGLSLVCRNAMDLHKKRHEKRRALGLPPLKKINKIVMTFSAGLDTSDQEYSNVLFEQKKVKKSPTDANPKDSLDQPILDSETIIAFHTVSEMGQFRVDVVKKGDSHVCSFCRKEFETVDQATKHAKYHMRKKNFQCDECGLRIRSRSHYNLHKQRHELRRQKGLPQKKPQKSWSCTFQTLKESRDLESDTFKCKICKKQFKKLVNLDYHIRRHFKKFKCSQCNELFERDSDLKEHEVLHQVKAEEQAEKLVKEFPEVQRNAVIVLERLEETELANFPGIWTYFSKPTHQDSKADEDANCEASPGILSVNSNQHPLPNHKPVNQTSKPSEDINVKELPSNENEDTNQLHQVHVPSRNEESELEKSPEERHDMTSHPSSNSASESGRKQGKKDAGVSRISFCQICNKDFKESSAFKMDEHIDNHFDIFQCPFCCFGFSNKSAFWLHVTRSDHGMSPGDVNMKSVLGEKMMFFYNSVDHLGKQFLCKLCGQNFTDRKRIKSHMMSHFDSKINQDDCYRKVLPNCTDPQSHQNSESSPSCVAEVAMKCKEERTHPEGLPENQLCQKSETYHDHMFKSGDDYMCSICQRLFTNRKKIKKHVQMHIRERNVRCNICSKGFTFKSNLLKHLTIHDRSRTKENAVKSSPVKNQRIASKGNTITKGDNPSADSVFKRNSVEEYIDEVGDYFICTICAMKFETLEDIIVHVRSHLTETESKQTSFVVNQADKTNDHSSSFNAIINEKLLSNCAEDSHQDAESVDVTKSDVDPETRIHKIGNDGKNILKGKADNDSEIPSVCFVTTAASCDKLSTGDYITSKRPEGDVDRGFKEHQNQRTISSPVAEISPADEVSNKDIERGKIENSLLCDKDQSLSQKVVSCESPDKEDGLQPFESRPMQMSLEVGEILDKGRLSNDHLLPTTSSQCGQKIINAANGLSETDRSTSNAPENEQSSKEEFSLEPKTCKKSNVTSGTYLIDTNGSSASFSDCSDTDEDYGKGDIAKAVLAACKDDGVSSVQHVQSEETSAKHESNSTETQSLNLDSGMLTSAIENEDGIDDNFDEDGDISYDEYDDDRDSDYKCESVSDTSDLSEVEAVEITSSQDIVQGGKRNLNEGPGCDTTKSKGSPLKQAKSAHHSKDSTRRRQEQNHVPTGKHETLVGITEIASSDYSIGESGKFHCNACSEMCDSVDEITNHIRSQHMGKRYQCKLCIATFNTAEEQEDHCTGNKHLRPRPHSKRNRQENLLKIGDKYKCKICLKEFLGRSNCESHIRYHFQLGKHTCDECGLACISSYTLRTHKYTHLSYRPYNCMICSKSYPHKMGLRAHEKTHTEQELVGILNYLKCDKCGKLLATQRQLVNHTLTHKDNHICDVCGIIFETTTALANHQAEESHYKCSQCGKLLKHRDSFNTHVRNHADNEVYPCELCGKVCKTRSALQNHVMTHRHQAKYKCEICDESFRKQQHLAHHMKRHEDGGGKCEVCKVFCWSSARLEMHKLLHKTLQEEGDDAMTEGPLKVIKDYTCPVCEKVLGSTQLKSHLYYHTKKKMHKCHICDLAFNSKSYLQTHINIHNQDRAFQCEYCSRRYPSQPALNLHINTTHLKRYNGEFPCDICNRVMKNKHDLKQHKKCHEKRERNHACDECELKFYTAAILKSHKNTHKAGYEFICELCGQQYRNKYQLRNHMIRHEGRKDFKCELCGMEFYLKMYLKTHMTTHKNERKFKCSVCGKGFNLKSSLYDHMRIHTGEKPYQCKFCDRRFTDRSARRSHQRTHEVSS